ncbi:MAG: hypothetical protein CUN49_03935 [Candidatus Thermofonsia Clade 1 bacterium]|jgi:hypothetical protein|uniref:Dihydroorotate dehydrogenase electron transfer subunit iron-sulphur cluster binding domain-containing protein n=1 Tax=Candidatus Thermofonsia Clade 1 bacterium TaxID=2364210 RepID=A0A2M8PGQ9_9CHLR|nr:MAG: hypothetical protein CUN49_03935 [Candidatus Thermofonsia Clade 1 bacterium]RMF53061.1 MAG: hypothetical protein D6749_03300 [Chloroflexota bacterium]
MQQGQAIIERIRRISAGVQRLELAVEKPHQAISGGQFFLARTDSAYGPYLREAWLPIAVRENVVIVERPTRYAYLPNQVIDLLGPIGRPFPLRSSARTLLLIAYEATPAIFLLMLQSALARQCAATLVLIGQARRYPFEALPPALEVTLAEYHERWAEREQQIAWADQIFAAAPPPYDIPAYLRLLEDVQRIRQAIGPETLYGVFQPPMPCGIGACQACLVRLQSGDEMLACIDGLAFDLTRVNLLQNLPNSPGA